jgi:chaperonin GroES
MGAIIHHVVRKEVRSEHSRLTKDKHIFRRSIKMKLVPLFDRVVLEKEKMEETTASGIVLPGQDDKEKPGQAVVVAVGPGGIVDGKEIKMQVKAGDHVLFSKYAGSEVEVDGHKYTVVKQNDILAVVEK